MTAEDFYDHEGKNCFESSNYILFGDVMRFAEAYAEQERDTTINEIIDKVESMKGLAGRMAMGEWSSKMIEMLEGLKKEE